MRRETLLAYADAVPTAGVAADAQSSYGDGDGRSASAQAQVVVCDGDVNVVGGLPWAAWKPQATALSDQMHVGWGYLASRAEGNNGTSVFVTTTSTGFRQAKASM